MDERPLTLCVAGAPLDTGNLGVSALGLSILSGVAARQPAARLTVFDNGWGTRHATVELEGRHIEVQLLGVRSSRRVHRRESLLNMTVSASLGGLGSPTVAAVDASDAVVDVSGGDSFSDIYGPLRFRAIVGLKRFVLRRGRPLVLLPQTYGPFREPRSRQVAAEIVRGAAGAWARDEQSFAVLRELLGSAFDPSRHRCGVDLAFALPARPPAAVPDRLTEWLGRGLPVAGLNVSGLLWNDAESGARYRLAGDYQRTVERIASGILRDADARLALVPHVLDPRGGESDDRACEELLGRLAPGDADRVVVTPSTYAADEVKAVIGGLAWFCGTRMHSTIAALSSGVPTATVAYSMKAAGVFASCGQSEHVADATAASEDDVVERVLASWQRRSATRADLATHLPAVLTRAQLQLDDIVALAGDRGPRSDRRV